MKDGRSRRTLVACAAIALLIGVACASGSGSQQSRSAAAAVDRTPWNAEEMTRLTGELATAVREVRAAWRREPAFRDPSGANRRSAQQMDDTLRSLDQRTSSLHTRVKGGEGFEETLGVARNIGVLLNDLEVIGRSIMTTQWMNDRARPAMKLINEIAPYYGREPLFDPETGQRTDRP